MKVGNRCGGPFEISINIVVRALYVHDGEEEESQKNLKNLEEVFGEVIGYDVLHRHKLNEEIQRKRKGKVREDSSDTCYCVD